MDIGRKHKKMRPVLAELAEQSYRARLGLDGPTWPIWSYMVLYGPIWQPCPVW